MGSYKDLLVWNKGIQLAKVIYRITADYPARERFGLTDQMRRCSVSIPSNIAEGYGRGSDKELIHFLYISLGSSNELDTQLVLSQELSFLNKESYYEAASLNNEINKMLASLIYRRKNGLDTNSET